MKHKKYGFLTAMFVILFLFSLLPAQWTEEACAKAVWTENGYEEAEGPQYAKEVLASRQQTDYLAMGNGAERLGSCGRGFRQSGSMQKIMVLISIAAAFSCCSYNRRMFLECIQFFSHLLARFLCELITLEKKDGKKWVFSH